MKETIPMRESRWIIMVCICVLAMFGFCAAAKEGSSLFLLSSNGCGRATAYAATNKIVTAGSKTHASWLDSEGGRFWVRIRTYDHTTKLWSPTYTIGEAYDNHGGPALTLDPDGYLHAVWYPHHHPFRYSRSAHPHDASQWTKEIEFGNRCTYPAMVCANDGTLFLVCRESSDEQWTLSFYSKRPGHKWEGPASILQGHSPGGYVRWQASLALGEKGETLHMGFQVLEDDLGDHGYAIGYLQSRDKGKSWQKYDGQNVALPASAGTVDLIEHEKAGRGTLNLRAGTIAVDDEGVPWIMFSHIENQPFNAFLAFPGGNGSWKKISLLPHIQKHLPGRGVQTPGSIVFDRKGTMYVSATTIDASRTGKGAFWGDPTNEVVLLVSEDKGKTIRVISVSPPDLSIPNWLPNIERPTTIDPIRIPLLMYTHGHKGSSPKQMLSNDVFIFSSSGSLNSK